MKKYKFKVCDGNELHYTEEKYNELEEIPTLDNCKLEVCKKLIVQREDGKYFIILAPKDMFEVEMTTNKKQDMSCCMNWSQEVISNWEQDDEFYDYCNKLHYEITQKDCENCKHYEHHDWELYKGVGEK